MESSAAKRSIARHDDIGELPGRTEGERLRELLAQGTLASGQLGVVMQDHRSVGSLLFKPLFTVIEDKTTGEHHHPYVHYIFSDDETDLITKATLDALDPNVEEAIEHERTHDLSELSKERCLIVDLSLAGQHVVSAKSISKDWQILDTGLTVAPTFNGGDDSEEAGQMLNITGSEVVRTDEARPTPEKRLAAAHGDNKEDTAAAVNALASQFQRELDVLNTWTERLSTNLG